MQPFIRRATPVIPHAVITMAILISGAIHAPVSHATNSPASATHVLKPCPPSAPGTIGDCDRRYIAPKAAHQLTPVAPVGKTLTVNPTLPPPTQHPAGHPTHATGIQSNDLPDMFIYHFYKKPQEAGLPTGFPLVAYCGSNDGQGGPAKRVYFEVHNRGNVAAPATKVRIHFTNPQTQLVQIVDVPVEPTAAHTHVVKKANIPAGCYSAGSNAQCNFTLTIDPDVQIQERFENNNVQQSFCVGPTF